MVTDPISLTDTPPTRKAKHLFVLLLLLAIGPLGAQDVEPYVSPGAQIGWSGEGLFISFQVTAGVLTYLEPVFIAPAATLGYRIYRDGKVLFLDGQASAFLSPTSYSPIGIGMGTGYAWLKTKDSPEILPGVHFKMYAGFFFLGVIDYFRFDRELFWRDMGGAFVFPISLTGQAYAS